jgi:hypothetical protein
MMKDGAVVILAVAHHRRRPDYWVDRMTTGRTG